jgi:four helix bundle protein
MTHALAVYRLTKSLMRGPSTRHVAHQLFRAATAVAANYRSACLGRSRQEFVAKLGVVREEADEVVFWLEFPRLPRLAGGPETAELLTEARELAAIVSAAYRTSKSRLADKKPSNNK